MFAGLSNALPSDLENITAYHHLWLLFSNIAVKTELEFEVCVLYFTQIIHFLLPVCVFLPKIGNALCVESKRTLCEYIICLFHRISFALLSINQ
jgi:hypothetical protein